MRIIASILLAVISISLAACSAVGNVVPDKGPTMEEIYDSMGKDKPSHQKNNEKIQTTTTSDEQDVSNVRAEIKSSHAEYIKNSQNMAVFSGFHKLLNPDLKLYVFPHLAGQDQLPVPGYYTEFSAYEHTYYALPQETSRG